MCDHFPMYTVPAYTISQKLIIESSKTAFVVARDL